MCFSTLAVAPSNENIVWVGTGDAASGRIPLRGFGVWKSLDAGKTWAHMGLTETRHIGRIAVHPRNPDVVYVANVVAWRSLDGGRTFKLLIDGLEVVEGFSRDEPECSPCWD